MMFRKPMRLEKWIAYDGALVADVAEAINDAGGDADGVENERKTPVREESLFAASSFELLSDPIAASGDGSTEYGFDVDGDGAIDGSIAVPPASTGDGLVFWNGGVEYDSGSTNVVNIWLEISNSDGGTLELLDSAYWSNRVNELKALYGLQEGDSIAMLMEDTGDHKIGLFSLESYGLQYRDQLAIYKIENGAIRLGLIPEKDERAVETIIESLAYASNADSSLALNIKFYYSTANPWTWNGQGGGPNDPVFGDTGNNITDGDGSGTGGGENPGPGPDPDPGDDDDDIIPPVNPPGDSGGEGDDDGGEGDDDGGEGDDDSGGEGDGDSGSDSGGEGADAGGEGDGGQAGYIFQREDDLFDDESGGTAYIPDDDGDDQAADESDGDGVESAAAAAMLELSLDLENYIEIVQGDKAALAQALMLLETEYLLRGSTEWNDLRDPLREIFATGGREMDAVNRVLAQLKSQLEEFRRMPMDRRDGMMLEGLRELLDSAARRSAETNAMAAAVAKVADALREARNSGAEPPDVEALAALFEREYDLAMTSWRERAGLSDAMGKDLANYRLVRRNG